MKQIEESFSPHFCYELIRICIFQILVFYWKRLHDIQIFFLGKEIHLFNRISINRFSYPWLDYDIAFVIDNHIQLLGRQPKEITNFIRK